MKLSARIKQKLTVFRKYTGLLPLCCIIVFSVHGFGQTSWTGEYFFDEDGGVTAGGSKIYVVHTLTISESDGELKARLYSQGFQTSYDIHARAFEKQNKLEIYFESYGPDQAFAGLAKDDLMFSLEMSGDKLLTNWSTFKPLLESNSNNGEVRFVKSVLEGKEETTWKRVLYAKGDVAIALPEDFLYDDRKGIFTRDIIYAYFNGINIQLSQYPRNGFKSKKFRESLEKMTEGIKHIAPYYFSSFSTMVTGSKFSKRFHIVGPQVSLSINLNGRVENLREIGHFIDGIRIRGTGLGENDGPGTTLELNVSDLKRSEAINEALKRRSGKTERNIRYEIGSNNTESPENPIDTKDAVLIDVPSPGKSFSSTPRFLVQLRANGEVGDIVVYSSRPQGELKIYIEAVTKIKFIPAVRNGKNVDSWTMLGFPYSVIIFR